jgi:esterase
MERRSFTHQDLQLSYLDSGGSGPVLIALHAHWMEARTFAPLAAVLAPEWRVVALDQRGHGYSAHASSYTRQDYLDDLLALYEHLGIASAVLLGNSLGGVNAYQFAAAWPERVRGLIIEDIGVATVPGTDDTSFSLKWSGSFASREELAERVGARFLPYLAQSFRETSDGWRLAFDPRETEESQACLNGDHWRDWLASSCPALVIRGQDSRVTNQRQLEEMVERRPASRLEVLPGGHVVHFDNPDGFTAQVRSFLAEL